MSLKSKGTNAERELLHMFWGAGWACVRVAGSGSSRYPSPDLLASNRIRKVCVECKITKNQHKFFPVEEINQLKEFSSKFGSEPWIALKFKDKAWFFISLEDLNKTNSGFSIKSSTAEAKGLLFEEFVR